MNSGFDLSAFMASFGNTANGQAIVPVHIPVAGDFPQTEPLFWDPDQEVPEYEVPLSKRQRRNKKRRSHVSATKDIRIVSVTRSVSPIDEVLKERASHAFQRKTIRLKTIIRAYRRVSGVDLKPSLKCAKLRPYDNGQSTFVSAFQPVNSKSDANGPPLGTARFRGKDIVSRGIAYLECLVRFFKSYRCDRKEEGGYIVTRRCTLVSPVAPRLKSAMLSDLSRIIRERDRFLCSDPMGRGELIRESRDGDYCCFAALADIRDIDVRRIMVGFLSLWYRLELGLLDLKTSEQPAGDGSDV